MGALPPFPLRTPSEQRGGGALGIGGELGGWLVGSLSSFLAVVVVLLLPLRPFFWCP